MPNADPGGDAVGHTFSTTVGLLYVFNLIVGTGALALPRAFQTAGYALGLVLLLLSAGASFICATFIIEALAVANFALKGRRPTATVTATEEDGTAELPMDDNAPNRPIVGGETADARFRITRRVELTEMAHIFLGRLGVVFTYAALSIYLFGDLAIYSTTVPKSLMNVLCASPNTSAHEEARDAPCHTHAALPAAFTRHVVYRLCVLAFASFCAPMILVGMTRTKYVQLATTVSRWTAFLLMIALASVQLVANGAQARPPPANAHGFGFFFGVAVYAFMCHHSLPGLVTPMRNTYYVSRRVGLVYALIFVFYATLSLTGSFAFAVVQDVYTLNFFHDDQTGNVFYFFVDYFLALFPVFTLTSSYIIVAITLFNNLRVLHAICMTYWRGDGARRQSEPGQISSSTADDEEHEALLDGMEDNREDGVLSSPDDEGDASRPCVLRAAGDWRATMRVVALPALVVGLPTLLSLFTDNVLLLASVTGSYPGVGVQFVIPSALVLGARAYLRSRDDLADGTALPPEAASPFRHWLWPYVTLSWAAFCVLVVSWNMLRLGLG